MSTTTSGTTTATTTANASAAGATGAAEPAKLEVTAQLLTPDIYGIFIGIFALFISIVVLFTSGSILAVLVLWALIALIITVLFYYGIIDLERIFPGKKEVKVEKKPVEPSFIPTGGPMIGSEVFHLNQNQFTYDEAPAVCAAFGSQLATLEQVIEAYNGGAEWCGYGWTAGGLALYPTQKKTWDELQREVDPGKRTACGRPGVNGGYFDPSLKFGVNCFGFKPEGEFTPPAPVPGTDMTKFNTMVSDFKKQLNTFVLSPFSRNEWSGYDSTITSQGIKAGRSFFESFTNIGSSSSSSSYGSQFKQDLGKLVEGFANADEQYVEQLNTGNGSYSAQGPYGLRGDIGPSGPAGPFGPTGPQGLQGIAGSVGPVGVGVPGPTGGIGGAGPPGQQGNIGPMGPTGSQGPPGTAGSTVGVVGTPGARGPTGPAGVAGVAGAIGPVGPAGAVGGIGPAGPIGPQGIQGTAGSTVRALIARDNVTNIGTYWGSANREATQYCPLGKLPVGLTNNYHASGAMSGAFLHCV